MEAHGRTKRGLASPLVLLSSQLAGSRGRSCSRCNAHVGPAESSSNCFMLGWAWQGWQLGEAGMLEQHILMPPPPGRPRSGKQSGKPVPLSPFQAPGEAPAGALAQTGSHETPAHGHASYPHSYDNQPSETLSYIRRKLAPLKACFAPRLFP